ncbi:hypothetical protein, partial [Rhizobium sp. L43]|uniref:hypothetical protein n=1 Tax=Rhizobium sp. L43 TaxID=2035452 RepID=UPI001AEF7049
RLGYIDAGPPEIKFGTSILMPADRRPACKSQIRSCPQGMAEHHMATACRQSSALDHQAVTEPRQLAACHAEPARIGLNLSSFE